MQLVTTMKSNAVQYDWSTWLVGIMRSFFSGGAAALVATGGTWAVGLPFSKAIIVVGSSFLAMGLYRMGEFLALHGAPDKLQAALQQASDASDSLVQKAAQVQSAVADAKVSAADATKQ